MTRQARIKATTKGDLTMTALAATATTAAFDIEDADVLECELTLSAVTGTTPTLDVKMQGKTVNGDWYDIPDAAFPQQAAVTAAPVGRTFNVKGLKSGRWVTTVGGTTPAFTGAIAVDKIR